MNELTAYRQELLSALEGAVAELSKTVATIPSSDWQFPYKLGAHTPHNTLAHLLALEAQVFSTLLRRIVDEEHPLLPLFDEIAWTGNHYEPGRLPQAILEEFTHLRRQEVNWLRSLPPESWSRTARHPWWGVHTLQWWVELQLDYSQQHFAELAAYLVR